ncbi:hypothetical protein JKP88DRAFT_273061 [Tribonema minus]|uniref:Uncharacterized protein n=1 Tax=Tribonema minus TaxID=303371 RepID=A0A835YYF0_9STRA|nr:hypothetical protein JKP88DRAFT_273061 [Tribonema minus]
MSFEKGAKVRDTRTGEVGTVVACRSVLGVSAGTSVVVALRETGQTRAYIGKGIEELSRMDAAAATSAGGRLRTCTWAPKGGVARYEVRPAEDGATVTVLATFEDGRVDTVRYTTREALDVASVGRRRPAKKKQPPPPPPPPPQPPESPAVAMTTFDIPDDIGSVEFRGKNPVNAGGHIIRAGDRDLLVDGVLYAEGDEVVVGGRKAIVTVVDAQPGASRGRP